MARISIRMIINVHADASLAIKGESRGVARDDRIVDRREFSPLIVFHYPTRDYTYRRAIDERALALINISSLMSILSLLRSFNLTHRLIARLILRPPIYIFIMTVIHVRIHGQSTIDRCSRFRIDRGGRRGQKIGPGGPTELSMRRRVYQESIAA